MAKRIEKPATLRVVQGILPSTGMPMKITIYVNGAIRIERQGKPTLEEDRWESHYHLCGLVAGNGGKDITCIY